MQLPYYTPKPDNTHNVSMNLLQTCYYQALNHSSVCSPSFPPPSCLFAILFPPLPPSQWKVVCLSTTKSHCSLIQTKPKSPVSFTKGGPGLSHQSPWRKVPVHSYIPILQQWSRCVGLKSQAAKTNCLSSERSEGVWLTFCVSLLFLEFKSAWQLSYNVPAVTGRSSTTARTIDRSPFTWSVLTRKGCDFQKAVAQNSFKITAWNLRSL